MVSADADNGELFTDSVDMADPRTLLDQFPRAFPSPLYDLSTIY